MSLSGTPRRKSSKVSSKYETSYFAFSSLNLRVSIPCEALLCYFYGLKIYANSLSSIFHFRTPWSVRSCTLHPSDDARINMFFKTLISRAQIHETQWWIHDPLPKNISTLLPNSLSMWDHIATSFWTQTSMSRWHDSDFIIKMGIKYIAGTSFSV